MMSDATLPDDLRRNAALAELLKALRESQDCAARVPGRHPPGWTEAACVAAALVDLQMATGRTLDAFGIPWRPSPRWQTPAETHAELKSETHAQRRAAMRLVNGWTNE